MILASTRQPKAEYMISGDIPNTAKIPHTLGNSFVSWVNILMKLYAQFRLITNEADGQLARALRNCLVVSWQSLEPSWKSIILLLHADVFQKETLWPICILFFGWHSLPASLVNADVVLCRGPLQRLCTNVKSPPPSRIQVHLSQQEVLVWCRKNNKQNYVEYQQLVCYLLHASLSVVRERSVLGYYGITSDWGEYPLSPC